MICTDGSKGMPNYHCTQDGDKCHLPFGGDCYKLDKNPQAEQATASCLSELLVSRADSGGLPDINKGHFHEIADRCHVVLSNIDDHILEHPGMTSEMTRLCKDAQASLYAVMNRAWAECDKLFPAN